MTALTYIFSRFFFRLADFFHHWYVDGSKYLIHKFVTTFESMDRVFAFRITLRHITEPLYGDYSIPGRVFGFFFRPMRLLLGAVAYAGLGLIFFIIYILWILIPFIILLLAYQDFCSGYDRGIIGQCI